MPVWWSCTSWTPSSIQNGPNEKGLFIFLSCHLSECFLRIWSFGFFEFCHGAKILIKLCVTELDFLEKHFLPQKLGNGPKIFFLILKKIWSLISLKLFYNENLFYFLSSFTYPIFEKKSCTWDIDQNALSQADSRIFKSTISPEQIDETA